MASTELPRRIRFADFAADLASGELRKDGSSEKILLQDQPLMILRALVGRPGEMVSREELIQLLWNGNTNVDFDSSLNKAVNRLRVSLDDSADAPRYIETLSRRGYRLISAVELLDGASSSRSRFVRTIALVSASLVLLAMILFAWNRFGSAKKVMLAVLPFENLSNEPQKASFSDGMTDEMITQLGRLQPDRLGVIARGSVTRYRPGDQDARRIARELGVQYILEGSVRREGQRVRISVQLIQTSDQTHVWAQDYDGDESGVLVLQDRVARDVAGEIRVKLTPKGSVTTRTAQVDPEAYNLYLSGRYDLNRIFYKGGDERLQAALDSFNHAVEKDPLYAPAYAGLAEAYNWAALFDGAHMLEHQAKGRAAVEKALQLDHSLARAHMAMAWVLEDQWDFSGSEKELKLASELDPNDTWVRQMYAVLLMHVGRIEDSWAQIHLAATLDPQSTEHLISMGHYYEAARQWDKVIETSQDAIKRDPDLLLSYGFLALGYTQKGMIPEALRANEEGARRAGADMQEVNRLDNVLRKAYETDGIRGYLKKNMQVDLEAAKREKVPDPCRLADVYAPGGEIDSAFEWLEKCYQKHGLMMVALKYSVNFDALHSDPRWNDLLRRVGFPPN